MTVMRRLWLLLAAAAPGLSEKLQVEMSAGDGDGRSLV